MIAELGVDAAEIARLHVDEKCDAAVQHILPLYIQLRKEGFKHYPDLAS